MKDEQNKTEQILSTEPWYHGLLPREEMKVLLTQLGDFLVRFTDPTGGESRKFVLSVFTGSGADQIRHYVFCQKNERFAIEDKWFDTIADLLNYHHRNKEPVQANVPESVLIRPIGREPWEKQHSDVKLIKKLGEGAFGEVHMGEVRIGTVSKPAAIKLAKLESLTKEQIKEIMHEARLMRKFKHPNVVTFYGVAAGMEPLMVIMELANDGALDSYLTKNQASLTITKKSEMIHQAARGLEYLHNQNVIHRDIAARNCLYGGGQVKISDFGLSREGSVYKMNLNKKIPIKWLAPEVPRTGLYTFKSDVFAYGIMCWEVYHDGQEPYQGMKVADVLPKVQEGYRMSFRSEVPEAAANYITNRICCGDENLRVVMADILTRLPEVTGVESLPVDVDSYFGVPSAKRHERKEIGFILPHPSHPVNMAAAAAPAAAAPSPVATTHNSHHSQQETAEDQNKRKKGMQGLMRVRNPLSNPSSVHANTVAPRKKLGSKQKKKSGRSAESYDETKTKKFDKYGKQSMMVQKKRLQKKY